MASTEASADNIGETEKEALDPIETTIATETSTKGQEEDLSTPLKVQMESSAADGLRGEEATEGESPGDFVKFGTESLKEGIRIPTEDDIAYTRWKREYEESLGTYIRAREAERGYGPGELDYKINLPPNYLSRDVVDSLSHPHLRLHSPAFKEQYWRNLEPDQYGGPEYDALNIEIEMEKLEVEVILKRNELDRRMESARLDFEMAMREIDRESETVRRMRDVKERIFRMKIDRQHEKRQQGPKDETFDFYFEMDRLQMEFELKREEFRDREEFAKRNIRHIEESCEWELGNLKRAQKSKANGLTMMKHRRQQLRHDLPEVRTAPGSPDMELRRRDSLKSDDVRSEMSGESLIPLPIKSDQEIRVKPTKTHADARLNRVEWAVFQRLRTQLETEAAAIDVLVGEPVLSYEDSFRTAFGRPLQKIPQGKNFEKDLLPERIRINSTHLGSILEKVCINNGEDTISAPVVFVRPFRVLTYYKKELSDWLKKLEKSIDSCVSGKMAATGVAGDESVLESARGAEIGIQMGDEQDTTDLSSETETEDEDEHDPNDKSMSPVAIEHLRCLMQFINTDIGGKIEQLGKRTCEKISFSDVWYLFKPGIEVIGIDGKQAYRVINVTSVGHKVIPPFRDYRNKESAKSEETPITIKCAYIDFDGKQLGPVAKTFVITRFENRRPVTTLEVFPLRFHPLDKVSHPENTDVTSKKEENEERDADLPPGERLHRMLVKRGQKFIDVSTFRNVSYTGKHMYYAGPTLETRDEVESQVVVDFEAALGVKEHLEKKWKPDIQSLISPAPEEENNNTKPCEADCCNFENVHNDAYVEENRNSAYIRDLLPETRDKVVSISIEPRQLTHVRSEESEFTTDELAIMSYRVFGYILRTRKWAKLDLACLENANSSPVSTTEKTVSKTKKDGQEDTNNMPVTAFDQLVLPSGHKKMVISLIAQHFRDKVSAGNQDEQVDIIRGKGKGLIILLHGAPGVGKTTTAEGVAEKFNRPLFQITCGDLGTTAEQVEETLDRNFSSANRWGSILLLDEADVFLAARTKEDFQRNGLVAVFLRMLEYYAGILFLTTNRIGDFDEAFASRIHISLYYPPLNQDNTVKVFELNLGLIKERFEGKERYIKIDSLKIGAFAWDYWAKNEKARWNGRQIRNACQTALALAEFESQGDSAEKIKEKNAVVNLEVRHFKVVSKAYLRFVKYLKDVYGADEDVRAKEAALRALDNAITSKGEVNSESEVDTKADEGDWLDEEIKSDDESRQTARPKGRATAKKSAAPTKTTNALRKLEAKKKAKARKG